MRNNCRGAVTVLSLLLTLSPNAQAQRLPPAVVVSNPQVYGVTVTTTFVVPSPETSLSAIRVAHALPTARPWDGLDGKLGVSAITFRPASGRIQAFHTNDSHSIIGELNESLAPGKELEFVSRFRVRSEERIWSDVLGCRNPDEDRRGTKLARLRWSRTP
jgi:hypothetical protein